jgi:SAM-dependent methyltransferase
MGVKLTRQKPKSLLLSIIYRIYKIVPLSNTTKFKICLNLEWIFDRLSHETSFKIYSPSEHPVRQHSKKFILENINKTNTVLDLGCNLGDISYLIAERAKEVIGIDRNKIAIEMANQQYKSHNLKFYNIEAIEFLKKNSAPFDILILSHILEHLDDPKMFLLNFKDHFKQMYIEVPDFDRNFMNHYRKDLKLSLIYSDDDHVSEFDRNELKSLLSECNIEIFKEEFKYGVQKLWCKVNNSFAHDKN